MAIAPDNSRGYTGMGQLRVVQKRFAEAQHRFRTQALVKNPHDLQALTGLAQLSLIERQPARAVARIQQQIAKQPDDAGMYVLLGQVQVSTKDYAAAEQSLTKALDLNPNEHWMRLSLTTAQISLVQLDPAGRRVLPEGDAAGRRDVRAYILLGSLQNRRETALGGSAGISESSCGPARQSGSGE